MAIADYTAFKAMVSGARQQPHITKNAMSGGSTQQYSTWVTVPLGGATPTTAVAPTSATTGALPGFQNSTGTQRLVQAEVNVSIGPVSLMICDRLSHTGGLSGIVTSAQTTNLPTAALTRYTDGVGVFAAAEVYSNIGTTATTITSSYTNSSGTAGQTSIATVFGGSGNNQVGRIFFLPLQQGDIGVRSVESITVAATTGTAGNFGVTLFKPIAIIPVPMFGQQWTANSLLNMGGICPQILDNACLFYVIRCNNSSGPGITQATFLIAEE